MKIDFEYIKVILEKFSFHWNILNDKRIIVNTSNYTCHSLIQKSHSSIFSLATKFLENKILKSVENN